MRYDEIDQAAGAAEQSLCGGRRRARGDGTMVRDAGYDPVNLGGLEQARAMEGGLGLLFAANRAGLGPFFYRWARPGEL
jgi:predicted dinucleotide-binding enzyme